MKILYLKLKNFLHIYSGLNKTEIELDFSKNNKVINVIIGKMGSCKSVILGHLQPFYGFGTLDTRNQDNIILDNEDGEKIIIYENHNNIYQINHKYLWKNGKHTVKSYIKKNDLELNPNGNVTSFKSLVEIELGITPNDLSLLRLGPNVTNLIDMSAAERKSFMASKLKDTEIYALLYKKLNEDMRNLNAKANILAGKITKLTKDSVEDMQEERSMLVGSSQILQDKLDEINKLIGSLEGRLADIYKGRSKNDYISELKAFENEYDHLSRDIETREHEIDDIKSSFQDIHEVAEKLGAIKNEIGRNREELDKLENEYKTKKNELGKFKDKSLILQNKDQIENLKATYNEILAMLDDIENQISKFHCEYGTTQIRSLLAQLNTINELISDVSLYNHNTVMKILSSDSSILRDANHRIDIINRRKYNLQRELGNLKFADNYEPSETLFFPPFCPTKDCPYYKTHPMTLKKSLKGLDLSDKYIDIQQQIDQCDHEIDILSEYPIIYTKIQSLRQLWGDISVQLNDLHVLKTQSLTKIFMNIFDQKWYDYDKLIDILNLCVKRDKYYELMEKAQKMKAEIIAYSNNDMDLIIDKINKLNNEIEDIINKIESIENSNKLLNKNLEITEKIYEKLSLMEEMIKELKNDKDRLNSISEKISLMKSQYKDAEDIEVTITNKRIQYKTYQTSLRQQQEKINNLNIILNDISCSQKEFIDVQRAQGYLKDIVEAVSSTKGIPLVYIKLFLNQCRDTVNDLISDVFGDTIEILDFDISENDFKIPYSINGNVVKDISSASQGQRSIISLALSFALVRQSISSYNILLLDEMDGPLYKEDRNKFISILFKQIQAINAEQIFIVSHNNTFDGHNVNVIMTTDEIIDRSHQITIMHV